MKAAKDASDLVAKLRAYLNSKTNKVTPVTNQTPSLSACADVDHVQEHAHLKICGLDLYEGVVRDNKKAGVLEPAISKIKSLKFATKAAITTLRCLVLFLSIF